MWSRSVKLVVLAGLVVAYACDGGGNGCGGGGGDDGGGGCGGAPPLEENGPVADGGGTMCATDEGGDGDEATGTGGMGDGDGDGDCSFCSGGDLEGHIFRVRPNALPLPPYVAATLEESLSFRLFGTTNDWRITNYEVTHYAGHRLTGDMDVVPIDALGVDPPFSVNPKQQEAPNSTEVFDTVELNLAPGINIVEWQISYQNNVNRRLLALVELPVPSEPPRVIHMGTGTGPVSGEANVYQVVTVTGSGFGDRQVVAGGAKGQVFFGKGAAGFGGLPSGTTQRWSNNRIEVRVPTGSHAARSGMGEFASVLTADGEPSRVYPFAVLPRSDSPSAWDDQTCQFVGEDLYEGLLRYTKDADMQDFDHDGDLDVFSPVSNPVGDSERDDVLFINQIQTEASNDWSNPLSFLPTTQRVVNTDAPNFCGEDHDQVTGILNAVYESAAVDIDNDGDLDIAEPLGTCKNQEGDCPDRNWIRLRVSQASRSSSYEADFFFIDEGDLRIFDQPQNQGILSPAELAERVYDDVRGGDLDGDGDLDLIFGNRDREGFGVAKNPDLLLINDGLAQGGSLGWFTAQEIGDPQNTGHDALFFDYDQDGDQDVLLMNECSAGICDGEPPGFHVWQNRFVHNGVIASGNDPIDFVEIPTDQTGADGTAGTFVSGEVIDLDGDAYPDVAMVGGANVTIIRNDAGNLSVEEVSLSVNGYSISVADIDQDGYPDVVVADIGTGRANIGDPPSRPMILLNDGLGDLVPLDPDNEDWWFDPDAAAKVDDDPTVADYEVTSDFNNPIDVELGDLDGDGRIDFFVSQSERPYEFYEGTDKDSIDSDEHNPRADEDRIYLGKDECP